MNYGISVLFRTIPLLMALFCFGYGAFVLDMGTDPAKNVAGPVVMSLGMICIALFATAATIIRQIIHTYNTVVLYALPVLGYLAALLTFICGWEYISEAATASHFVAGHVICGVAFITACVATTATSSTRFTLMHVSGFKYREIAEKLNLPLGTVKSRIFFTRQKLQEELKDFR